jgi:hypothetical protein
LAIQPAKYEIGTKKLLWYGYNEMQRH